MIDILTEIQIARPQDIVADYASNPDNAPEWYVNIKSVEWETPKPLSVGSKVMFRAQFLGRELQYTYVITEYVPGAKLVMCTARDPFPMETTYTWESTDDGQTRMTLRNRGKPAGFFVLFAPFMKPAMRRANSIDLKRLQQILENMMESKENNL